MTTATNPRVIYLFGLILILIVAGSVGLGMLIASQAAPDPALCWMPEDL